MDKWIQLFRDSLACLCPRCKKGGLFAGYLRLVEKCENCGLALAKNDNADGPAVFLIFILGFLIVPPGLIFAMKVDWPLWAQGLLWGSIILAATLGLLRPAKAMTLLIQYKNRPDVFDDKL